MRKLFSITAFALMVLPVSYANAQAIDLENATRGAASANASNVQRALDSRAGLLERANARARGQAQIRTDVTTRSGLETRANANARANVGIDAGLRGNSANAGRPTLPPVASGRLARGVLRQRLDAEHLGEVRGRTRAAVEAGARGDRNLQDRRDREDRRTDRPTPPGRDRRALLQMRADVLAETRTQGEVSASERLLRMRLAQIDKMRDTALENGNERQLEQADKLEQLARWQFENQGSARSANHVGTIIDPETGEERETVRHPFRSGRMPAPIGDDGSAIQTETDLNANLETSVNTNAGTNLETGLQTEQETTTTVDP